MVTSIKIGLLIAFAILYVYVMVKMGRELCIYKSKEERRKRQIYPMMFAMTALLATVVYQAIKLWNYF